MIPELLQRYPIGSDITIMNTYYQRPIWEDGKKICDDFIVLVFKENKTGIKRRAILKKPNYTYYMSKPGTELDYCQLYVDKNLVDEINVPFTDLLKDIAERTDNKEFWKNNIQSRNKEANEELHKQPNVFFSDVNIEDHYRFKFAMNYTNNITKLNKGFFDIETDIIDCPTDFPEKGNCPVNAVTFLDEKSDTSYTFLLRDPRNPLIQKFEDKIASGQFNLDTIRKFVEEHTRDKKGKSQLKKFGLENTDYKIKFYDDELQLLKELFATMHACSPDFIEGWNSSAFDLQFIIDRCYMLGEDPVNVLCDQSWPVKVVRNYVDMKNYSNLPERGDYTFISGLPVFIDQEIQYASRRKSKYGSINSFKLDDTAWREAQIHKLDYHHITNDLGKLPRLDYETFVLYNIMDVIAQKAIEKKTQDLEYIFAKCVVNNTVYRKGHRQSVYLINRMASDWYKKGYIIGNNINRAAKKKPPRFPGAMVGEPTRTNDYAKHKIDGRMIWICDNLQDYDKQYVAQARNGLLINHLIAGKSRLDELQRNLKRSA